MAYNNPFWYNRDKSVDGQYYYVYDFSVNFDPGTYLSYNTDLLDYPTDEASRNYINAAFVDAKESVQIFRLNPYKHYYPWGSSISEQRRGATKYPQNPYIPIYGSSVTFKSKLNFLETIDNELKILPASSNNLIAVYNLKFLLDDACLGNLLKTIEAAAGTKYLKFSDPSDIYKNIIGLVEDYSINKISKNLNELVLSLHSYFLAPIFKWRTSSFLNIDSTYNFDFNKNYNKYDFVYYEDYDADSKLNNFWFAKQDCYQKTPGTYNSNFEDQYWTKDVFLFESKMPFQLKNKFDFHQFDYKNSFVQNLKIKENINTLKEYEVRFENISNKMAKSIMLFLEKRCGYRRFIYEFPFLLKKEKVFICPEWTHELKYFDCNDIVAKFIEDPCPNIEDISYEYTYKITGRPPARYVGKFTGSSNYTSKDFFSGFTQDGTLLRNGVPATIIYIPDLTYYVYGKVETKPTIIHWVHGMDFNGEMPPVLFRTNFFVNGKAVLKRDGLFFDSSFDFYQGKYYVRGCPYDDGFSNIVEEAGMKLFVRPGATTVPLLYTIYGTTYNGFYNGLLFKDGKLFTGVDQMYSTSKYLLGAIEYNSRTVGLQQYREDLKIGVNGDFHVFYERLFKKYRGVWLKTAGYVFHNGILYYNANKFTGIYNKNAYYVGKPFTGTLYSTKSPLGIKNPAWYYYYINGIPLDGSFEGVVYNGYFYKLGLKIISNGYYNNGLFVNGFKK